MTNSYNLLDYDFNSNFVKLEAGNVHYIDEGDGDILLFVHGSGTWSYTFRKLITHLSKNYRCIAIDLLGMGLSDKPSAANYSSEAHSERLAEFVDKLNLYNITLVVQEWGGPIAIAWALNDKPRVHGLVILNSFISCVNNASIEKWMLLACKIPIVGAFLIRSGAYFRSKATGLSKQQRHDLSEHYQSPYKTLASVKPSLSLARQIPLSTLHKKNKFLESLQAQLMSWEVPTLLVWGMRDNLYTIEQAGQFCQLLPFLHRPKRFNEAGHLVQEKNPDELAEDIDSFMEYSFVKHEDQWTG